MGKIIKEDFPIGVEMHTEKGAKITRKYEYDIDGVTRFGRELKISPKSNATISEKGFKVEFFGETVNVVVNIAGGHSADLIMSKTAWDAFVAGADVNIITTEDFRKKYLHKK